MENFLIYLFFIAFWVENSLNFYITNIVGLSLFNLCLYLLMLLWVYKILVKEKVIEYIDLYKYIFFLVYSLRLFHINKTNTIRSN